MSKGQGKDTSQSSTQAIPFRLSDAQFAALSEEQRMSISSERTYGGAYQGSSGEVGVAGSPREDTRDIRREPGSIALPNNILTVNLVDSLVHENQPLPSALEQWRNEYDFYSATASIGIVCNPHAGARGITKVVFDVALQSDNPHSPPQIDDVGPQTTWVDGSGAVTADVKIDTRLVSGLLKFVTIGPVSGANIPLPSLSWEYKYAHTAKTPSVIVAHGGATATWTFTKTNEYIDGQFDLLILLRRKNDQRSLGLVINSATVTFHYPFFSGGDVEIPLAINRYIALAARPTTNM